MPKIMRVSAITLRVSSMVKSLSFYRDVLHLQLVYGSEESSFSSFDLNGTYLNIELSDDINKKWGRIIFHCDDVDAMHDYLKSVGYDASKPRNGTWGERFFHIEDPDGHEISIAQRLDTN
ncbi:MAG: VOC family protein [Nitrososphaerales archaeon]